MAFYQQAEDASGVGGLVYIIASASASQALIHHAVGADDERVAPLLAKAVELLEQPLGGAYSAPTWSDIALCAYDMGDLDTAATSVEKGLVAVSALSHLARPWLFGAGALVSLAQGDLEAAASRVESGATYAADNSIKIVEPFLINARGELLAAQGDLDGAVASFSSARDAAMDMGQRPLLLRIHRGAAAVLAAAGRSDAAEAEREAAARVIDDIAATFTDGEARARYVSTARAG